MTHAFTSEERERISRVNVENQTNEHGLSGGSNTSDYIFLLSIDEVFSLIGTGSTCSSIHCTSVYWWLRSPGSGYAFAAGVYGLNESGYTGFVNASGVSVDNFEGIHPAIWLNY